MAKNENDPLKPQKMKKEDKHRNKPLQGKTKRDRPSEQKEKAEDQEFPGYPHYPASEDIYNQEKEVNLDPNDLSKTKKTPLQPLEGNIKRFKEDMTGEDLDVPGSEADEAKANSGSEDEENNYYSLGGDRHNDLEEDNG